jgi:phosphate transport system protein
MRSKFDEQLSELNDTLVEMGQMVQAAIAAATKALVEQDTELAQQIILQDDEIDDIEKEIESLALRIMLQQHPVAGDLRYISSVLKIVTDLERIGDHAQDISEITLLLAGKPFIKKLEYIPRMADATMEMIKGCIEAFVEQDLEKANAVIQSDNIVDELFVQAKDVLMGLIHANAENGTQAIDLIIIAKYFERIGDHAANVAEWVVFSLTGMHKRRRIL